MNKPSSSAVITGIGAICPIGHDIATMTESLRASRHGMKTITSFSTEGLRVSHATLVEDEILSRSLRAEDCSKLDRTAQLAIVAARQAVADAGISREALQSGRAALVMGICAGGIASGGMPVFVNGRLPFLEAENIYNTSHYLQTQAVASDLGLTGPVFTLSTACASSTSALACALTLLEAGRSEIVVVGGADAYSLSIYAGFYSLGAMSDGPTSPFSKEVGATFGEGAGCVVLETAEHAARRGARSHGVLVSCGVTSDAHHITSPHPSGEGLRRAMQRAIEDADLKTTSIDYINAHGTGTQENDISETIAIRTLYGDSVPPPISSSKSYFGHTLGGAGILEFISSLVGLEGEFLPATLNYTTARPGCDLDYVPNVARPARIDAFLSISAAFGGINAVALGARAGTPSRAARALQPVSVTGIGIISPIGLGIEEFRVALKERRQGIAPIERFDASGCTCHHAALVRDFSTLKLAPTVDVRRMDSLTRFAVVAASMALKDAGLTHRLKPERIGIHVALTRGPMTALGSFRNNLASRGIAGLSAKYFPAIVFSTISGLIAQAHQIKGASMTFVDGACAGFSALAHGCDYLALHSELDALIVIAADELGSLSHQMFDRLGLLAPDPEGSQPYAPDGRGFVPGEGAVALILERTEQAMQRGGVAYGEIDGLALGSEGKAVGVIDENGTRLEALARDALLQAGGSPDVVYGTGRSSAVYDTSEVHALKRLLAGSTVPLCCLNGQLGLAEACNGLFAASAALLSLRFGEVYPSVVSARAPVELSVHRESLVVGKYRRALVLGGTELGNSAAFVFTSRN